MQDGTCNAFCNLALKVTFLHFLTRLVIVQEKPYFVGVSVSGSGAHWGPSWRLVTTTVLNKTDKVSALRVNSLGIGVCVVVVVLGWGGGVVYRGKQ